MKLTIEEVEKIASLARIELSEVEKKRHAETISVVLDYMKVLDEVDVHGIEMTSQVTGLENVLRDDVVEDCDYSEKLVKQMPEIEYDKLKVPGVFSGNND